MAVPDPQTLDEAQVIAPDQAGATSRAAPPAPDPSDHQAVGIQVLRDLLRIEDRPNRVRRVLRVWESKVSMAIRGRDLEGAEAWMRGVTGNPDIPPEHEEAVAASIAALSRPALIDDLLVWLVDREAIGRAAGLFSEWGAPIVSRMIDLMTVDDPPVNRRHMVEVLTHIGRSDSRLLTPHAGDHRWFVVRNLAIALGRSGRLATIPTLRTLGDHRDARVRVEAIRGLATVDPEASLPDMIAALSDPDPRVRGVAVSLLRACPSPEVIPRVTDLVMNVKLYAAQAERLVDVIAERREDAARDALQTIATTRGRKGAPKPLRMAARRRLAGRTL